MKNPKSLKFHTFDEVFGKLLKSEKNRKIFEEEVGLNSPGKSEKVD